MGVFVFGRPALFAEAAFLAGVVLATAPCGAGLFTAGTTATLRVAFFAVFLAFAQRFFCADAIFARTSTLMV
jgi:hypothetical protein